jgi:DNA polymerase-3 subunit gamma/tau
LKTLEEPPSHVVFILATTNPQKVIPTIVSRTQHYEFKLLGKEDLMALARKVNADAGLSLDDEVLAEAVSRGRGSARDMLSALEQLAASGGSSDDSSRIVKSVANSILAGDRITAVQLIEQMIASGSEAVWVATLLLGEFHERFLAALASNDNALLRKTTKVMERLGQLAIYLRDALDPALVLSALVLRVIDETDAAVDLLRRVEALEKKIELLSRPGDPASNKTSAVEKKETNLGSRQPIEGIRRGIKRATSRTEQEGENENASAEKVNGAKEEGGRTDPEPGLSRMERLGSPSGRSLELLRTRIQADWLDKIVERLEPACRAFVRDTRIATTSSGHLAVVCDHVERKRKLEPFLDPINELIGSLYGGVSVVLVVEGDAEIMDPIANDTPETGADQGIPARDDPVPESARPATSDDRTEEQQEKIAEIGEMQGETGGKQLQGEEEIPWIDRACESIQLVFPDVKRLD